MSEKCKVCERPVVTYQQWLDANGIDVCAHDAAGVFSNCQPVGGYRAAYLVQLERIELEAVVKAAQVYIAKNQWSADTDTEFEALCDAVDTALKVTP